MFQACVSISACSFYEYTGYVCINWHTTGGGGGGETTTTTITDLPTGPTLFFSSPLRQYNKQNFA